MAVVSTVLVLAENTAVQTLSIVADSCPTLPVFRGCKGLLMSFS